MSSAVGSRPPDRGTKPRAPPETSAGAVGNFWGAGFERPEALALRAGGTGPTVGRAQKCAQVKALQEKVKALTAAADETHAQVPPHGAWNGLPRCGRRMQCRADAWGGR